MDAGRARWFKLKINLAKFRERLEKFFTQKRIDLNASLLTSNQIMTSNSKIKQPAKSIHYIII